MKMNGRAGHTDASPGASAILNENKETREIFPRVYNLLDQFNEMHSSQPSEDTPYPPELSYGIRVANANGADFFFSIHFNKCYDNYNGKLGVEVLCMLNDSTSTTIGNRILTNMANLGFNNRGLRDGSGLGEINSTNMSAIIVEVCFTEATEDAALFKKLGYNVIARAIANGIDPRVILQGSSPVVQAVVKTPAAYIEYISHIQNKGWEVKYSRNGETSGTTGQSLRDEAIAFLYFGPGKLKIQGHVQNYGWMQEMLSGQVVGTVGLGLRLEAIKLWLEGAPANYYVEYRVHVQNKGWMPWVRDGQIAGTTGEKLRIEAIEARIVMC